MYTKTLEDYVRNNPKIKAITTPSRIVMEDITIIFK